MADERPVSAPVLPNPLSEREMEVAALLVTGASNSEIARDLVISPHTVKVHLRNIFEKLQVNSRTEASLVLVQHGWVIVPGIEVPIIEVAAPPDPLPLSDVGPALARWQRGYLLGALILTLLLFAAPRMVGLAQAPPNLLSDANRGEGAPVAIRLEPRWELRTPLQQPLTRHAMVAQDSRLYIFGGEQAGGAISADALAYDLTTNEWRAIAPLPRPLSNLAAAVSPDGRIYVAGGSTPADDETEGERIPVAEVHVHPDYAEATADNDIALLRLARPAVLTATVKTIPMATVADAALVNAGILATVTGWGTRSEGAPDYPDELYEVQVPIVDQSACEFAYGAIGQSITGNMLCAGLPQGGKDSCYGDSGGPLIVPDGNGGFKLAGIVSWGEGCAQPGLPGVYTRVANFVEWVALQRVTITTGRYMATDRTPYPGHTVSGSEPVTTLVKAIKTMLPLIVK